MKAIEVEPHLSIQELEDLYRNAERTLEQRRTQVILLRAEGMAPGQVARVVRMQPHTISALVRRYNEHGPEALLDARRANPGRTPLLDQPARDALAIALKSPPPDAGRWTGPKVARWIEQRLGREPGSLQDAMGWRTLRSLGLTYKSSRPRHTDSASAEERGEWKKN